MSTRVERTAEQRRRRSDVRRRILDAALALLEERRWPDIPVDEVTRAAGLSRTAFYRHFDDRDQLLLALMADTGARLANAGRAWREAGGDPIEAVRAGLAEMAATMVEHGRLVQAIVDASAYDPEVRAAWEELLERLIGVTAERIRADVAAGRSEVRDPDGVAAALARMSAAHLLAGFGRRPLSDPDRAVATLTEVWAATIYGRRPA